MTQFVAILSQYFAGIALGIDLGLDYYLFFIPIVFIITLLPITIVGFGLREVSYIYFLENMGVSPEKAVLISLITYLGIIIITSPSLLFKLKTRK